MPLREHLAELRNRILLVVAGIVAGAIGGWFLFDPAFSALQQPLIDIAERDNALVTVNFAGVASALDMRFKVSIFLGLLISAPWCFIRYGPSSRPASPARSAATPSASLPHRFRCSCSASALHG